MRLDSNSRCQAQTSLPSCVRRPQHPASLAQRCRWGTESLVEVPRKDVHPAPNVGVVTQYRVGNLSSFGCLTSQGALIQVQWELKGKGRGKRVNDKQQREGSPVRKT